ncbi:MAG: glycoside hydrolase family 25 protein [Lachnospiraceae bacterium]|nr:glycoside hydrolase family 25 protein [Lachnospiraceae bacterium]
MDEEKELVAETTEEKKEESEVKPEAEPEQQEVKPEAEPEIQVVNLGEDEENLAENKTKKDNSKKGKRVLGIIGLFVLAVIVAYGAFILTDLIRERNRKEEIDRGEVVIEEEPILPIGEKRCKNITEVVAALNSLGNVRAAVAGGSDGEYITVVYEEFSISYLNEYVWNRDGTYGKVIVSNGTKNASFDWNYVLQTDKVEELIPVLGDYLDNGRIQLAFAFTDEISESENTLHVISSLDLMEYYVINPIKSIKEVAKIDSFMDAGFASVCNVIANDRTYCFKVKHMTESEAFKTFGLNLLNNCRYEIGKNKLSISSMVELTGAGWIGEIRSNITPTSKNLLLADNLQFYMYVDSSFADIDYVGIAKPVDLETALLPRVRATGAGGEKVLTTLDSKIPLSTVENENIKLDANGFKYYEENGQKASHLGIDVSKWNNNIDWKKVKEAGVEFAIIRLGNRTTGSGQINLDPYFRDNMMGAIDAGIKVGVYFYTQAITVEEAKEEADFCIENLKEFEVTYPVVFDSERYDGTGRADKMANSVRTEIAKAFLERVKSAGYKPAIYMSTNWSLLNINLRDLTDYDLWYAYYGEELYYPYKFTIWQYASDGSVPGVSGDVDVNISFKEY